MPNEQYFTFIHYGNTITNYDTVTTGMALWKDIFVATRNMADDG
jgi:formylmethanofuran dehydrogenase subunit D